MLKVEYRVTDQRDLDLIGSLWEKLNEYHRVRARSPDHADHFADMTFQIRKKGLLEKARKGTLRLDIAIDAKTDKVIGYCASTVTEDKQGEIESIFVEADYRRQGIGSNLMKKALAWMDSLPAASTIIGVAVGNEEVLSFYARFNFHPRTLILHGGRSSRR
jgi:ribosomal protein S18 acetylase RimI-like enzyme